MKPSRRARLFVAASAALLACAPSRAAQLTTRGAVSRATLKNGLRVIIVRNPLAPVAATVMNYLAGSDEAPPGFPGMAHAAEHMMFRGSRGLSADQLAQIASDMGGDFNADTQQALTQYFFTAPAEDLGTILRIESIRMRSVLDTEALWGKERGAIEQEVSRDLSDPEYVFFTKLLRSMFKGTPYGHDALGTRPSFDKTTGAMLKDFHDRWYAPNNAVLVIAGDVRPARALEEVQKFFGGIPPAELPARPAFKFEKVLAQERAMDTDLPYGMAVFTFRFPGSDSPDFAAAQILADALSSQRGRLYGLVPQGKALFAAFSYYGLRRAGLGYAVAGFPEGADSRALLKDVRGILEGELKRGISPELVEASKRHEIADAEFQKNSVSGLAMEWSQAVAGEGRNSPEDDIDAIRRVTPQDVSRVAREYIDFSRSVSAILTPRPSGKPLSSKGFGGQESFLSSKNPGAALPAWARAAARRLDIPSSTLDPRVSVLPNGIKLIVQPESVSRTVSVYGRIDTNPLTETEKGKDGVDQALDQLFSYGSTTLGRLAFQKALDDIAAEESAGADFSLNVLSDEFAPGVRLLADNELSPALPEKDFKIIQPQLAAETAGELKSPAHLASRAMLSGLFPKNDPVQREATPGSIRALAIQDVRGYYRKAFRPDMTTIVVIGDVTPEKARGVIEKYFGGWKAQGPKPDTLFPPAPENAPSSTQVPDQSRVQDGVALAQTLAMTRANPDYYALELGNHVLGGAFYASRLSRDLREKRGLVYSVSSSFDVGRSRGVYRVDYACDPGNVSKARAIITDDLEAMRRDEVSPRELRAAKVRILRDIPLSESSVDGIAAGWLSRSILGLPLDEPVRAARRYLKLDAAQVRAAFAKWLRPKDMVEVIRGPAARP